MTPKRKVTDLLPTEAILISSDAERDAVLQLMDRAGWVWNDNSEPFEYVPDNRNPYCLTYKAFGSIGICISLPHYEEYKELTIYPATDFIPTELERGLTIIKGDGSIITAQNQDGRVFDIEPIPIEAEKVVSSGIGVFAPDNSLTIRIDPEYEKQLLVDYHNFILDDPRAKECDVVVESVLLFLKTRNPETK